MNEGPSTIRVYADSVLDQVLNGEASWAWAYRWLDRATADNPELNAEIRDNWRRF